jgi:hypothetical protein
LTMKFQTIHGPCDDAHRVVRYALFFFLRRWPTKAGRGLRRQGRATVHGFTTTVGINSVRGQARAADANVALYIFVSIHRLMRERDPKIQLKTNMDSRFTIHDRASQHTRLLTSTTHSIYNKNERKQPRARERIQQPTESTYALPKLIHRTQTSNYKIEQPFWSPAAG